MDNSIFTSYTHPPISTIGQDGKPAFISQGTGIGIREHDDVMLAFGYSRSTSYESILTQDEFMVVTLDTGNCSSHHIESRLISTEKTSVRVYVYDVTEYEGLIPAGGVLMKILNQKGAILETPGVDTYGIFRSYPDQLTNPFSSLTPIENTPLWSDALGGSVKRGSGTFPSISGRHYLPNHKYAAVIENIATETSSVFYRYNWHEY